MSQEFNIIIIPQHLKNGLLANGVSLETLSNLNNNNKDLLKNISKYDLVALYAVNQYISKTLFIGNYTMRQGDDTLLSTIESWYMQNYSSGEVNAMAIDTLSIVNDHFSILLKENRTSDSAPYIFNVYDNAILITLNDNILLDNNSKKSFINDLVKTMFTAGGDERAIDSYIFAGYVRSKLNTLYN